ncbi:MAG: GNAT family N-acetyltransferase [Rhizobiaceae bacterium]|nr:GNAT family N-acetyltransferase [Rhizobiaceae bacterium]MCV0405764.1 GNAT family N-acetyltransferase [Rhizobiaceae bacterium]
MTNDRSGHAAHGLAGSKAPGVTLRHATATDAGEIAKLFLISSDGLARYIWSRIARPGEALEDVGAARYARGGVAFSFENCLVATDGDGLVVGMAHAFEMEPRQPGDIEDDPVLRPYAELEEPGSLYLSGLAVHEGHRGLGIGAQLMNRVEAQASAGGLPSVSLICFEANKLAMSFYRRRGYAEVARRPIVPHPSLRYGEGDAVLLARQT